MAWSADKKIVQFQVEPDLYALIEKLAKMDKRSVAKECEWLIEQGITRREAMLAYTEEKERGVSGQ